MNQQSIFLQRSWFFHRPARCRVAKVQWFAAVVAWMFFCSVCSSRLVAGPPEGSATFRAVAADWLTDGLPLLQTYCVDCHSADVQEGGVDLSPLTKPGGVDRHQALASRAVHLIRFGAMPPEDAYLPEPEERQVLADRLDELLFQSTCDLRPKPGKVTARRLNRYEYQNVVRDLFGFRTEVTKEFPSDEVGGGFDNNADVLSVSPLLMEKYLDAAEQISERLFREIRTEIDQRPDGDRNPKRKRAADRSDSVIRQALTETVLTYRDRIAAGENLKPAEIRRLAAEGLNPLIRRAFREEVSEAVVDSYADLVSAWTEREEAFIDGLAASVTAVLVSPRFLFRVEVPEPSLLEQARAEPLGDAKTKSPDFVDVPLSSTQLASRLSFFLWASVPDQALLDAAKDDRLRDPKYRREQVRRMLTDPKSDALAEAFATQWFSLGNLDEEQVSTWKTDSGESAGIAAEQLRGETTALFEHVLAANLPVTELLTADYTFVTPSLAKWYELPDADVADADEREIVRLSIAGGERRGILGHAGVLAATSYPNRNSPVLRGKWILENVLGTPPPEAPAGVPALEDAAEATPDATLREQLELHRANPSCAACHRVMDSLGFGLEVFDHRGRARAANDPGFQMANGELPGGRRFQGARQLAEVLAETESRRFAETAVRRLLAYGLGRELRPADRCFVDEILSKTQSQGFRMRDLIEAVVDSPPMTSFQWHVSDMAED